MNEPTTKTCERCGATLSCGAANGKCWCIEVDVKADVLKQLQSRYGDCLCPECLKTLATGDDAEKT